jgi:hypothetical protein
MSARDNAKAVVIVAGRAAGGGMLTTPLDCFTVVDWQPPVRVHGDENCARVRVDEALVGPSVTVEKIVEDGAFVKVAQPNHVLHTSD